MGIQDEAPTKLLLVVSNGRAHRGPAVWGLATRRQPLYLLPGRNQMASVEWEAVPENFREAGEAGICLLGHYISQPMTASAEESVLGNMLLLLSTVASTPE